MGFSGRDAARSTDGRTGAGSYTPASWPGSLFAAVKVKGRKYPGAPACGSTREAGRGADIVSQFYRLAIQLKRELFVLRQARHERLLLYTTVRTRSP